METEVGYPYMALHLFLEASDKDQERLSFRQIEIILRARLPEPAYVSRSWWENEIGEADDPAKAWMEAGFSMSGVHPGDFVLFERQG